MTLLIIDLILIAVLIILYLVGAVIPHLGITIIILIFMGFIWSGKVLFDN